MLISNTCGGRLSIAAIRHPPADGKPEISLPAAPTGCSAAMRQSQMLRLDRCLICAAQLPISRDGCRYLRDGVEECGRCGAPTAPGPEWPATPPIEETGFR